MKLASLPHYDAVLVQQSIADYLRWAEAKRVGELTSSRAAESKTKPPINPQLVRVDLLAPEPLPPGRPRRNPPPGEPRMPWAAKITEFLATTNHPATTAEIATRLGLRGTQQIRVSNALQSMRRAGKVEEAGRRKTPGMGKALVLWQLKRKNIQQENVTV